MILGIGDTGIDVKSTFFYDPHNSVKYGTTGLSSHRKIALYVPLIDSYEAESEGHGTHVSGIAVGQANSESASRYNVLSG